MGTPTEEQLLAMNPNYQEFKFPQIRAYPWTSIFKNNPPLEVVDIISKMLEYVPEKRITAIAVSTLQYGFDIKLLRLKNVLVRCSPML